MNRKAPPTSRDDFSSAVKDALAKRVGLQCSNPGCRQTTSGPHSFSDKTVNLGVASHITAAAQNGPRYNSALSPGERSAIENAIWLCQNCAKLIDNDVSRYPVMLLTHWKEEAEAEAQLRLEQPSAGRLPLPPSSGAGHSPLPQMMGLTYHAARARLIELGWQPRMRHWSHASHPDVRAGAEFWNRGYWEIINAWGTGTGMCTFAFHDVYGNFLTVQTEGEENEAEGWHACVTNWYFTRKE